MRTKKKQILHVVQDDILRGGINGIDVQVGEKATLAWGTLNFLLPRCFNLRDVGNPG